MRHSDIRLTMEVYTDPKLLDVRGALEALPAPPLNAEQSVIPDAVRATGTDDLTAAPFAPPFAPTADFASKSESFPGKTASPRGERVEGLRIAASAEPVKRKGPLT